MTTIELNDWELEEVSRPVTMKTLNYHQHLTMGQLFPNEIRELKKLEKLCAKLRN